MVPVEQRDDRDRDGAPGSCPVVADSGTGRDPVRRGCRSRLPRCTGRSRVVGRGRSDRSARGEGDSLVGSAGAPRPCGRNSCACAVRPDRGLARDCSVRGLGCCDGTRRIVQPDPRFPDRNEGRAAGSQCAQRIRDECGEGHRSVDRGLDGCGVWSGGSLGGAHRYPCQRMRVATAL